MAINNINGGSNIPVDSQRLNQQQNAANQATNRGTSEAARLASAPRQDSVSLTQSAQTLAQPQRRSAEAPVNQERVERLREAISNGEYRINADRLASNIIRFEADLFGE